MSFPLMKPPPNPVKRCCFLVRAEVWERFVCLARFRNEPVSRQVERLIRSYLNCPWPLPKPSRQRWRDKTNVVVRLPRDLYNRFQNRAYQAGSRSASDCLDRLMGMVFDIPAEHHKALGRPRKDGLEPGDRPLEDLEDIPIEMRTDLTQEEKDRRIWALMRKD